MSSQKDFNRRDFIKGAAGVGAALGARRAFARQSGRVLGANDRINVAIIGAGGRGSYVGAEFAKIGKEDNSCQIVAVCDVYQRRVTKNKEYFAKNYSPVDGYLDYREVISRKDIDAVIVATPDHWHAKIALAAMDAGKDVYCEKPMVHTIEEVRQMID
ncbi:MAG TPA: Gfo/Idh/MocA family oxidoreductase, partial [Bryobacteraceae bacterium]|nr:Gfo/Idh/MocA family oxidoreductase [Bryobacteraceae bacterium]